MTFTDDNVILYHAKTADELQSKINSDMKLLDNWFGINLLTLNSQKTHYIILRNLTPNTYILLKVL